MAGARAAAADFTSALYLGLNHSSESLRWTELSTGTPAVLRRSPDATRAAQTFAALVGCGRAVVLSSTLHAFMDLFGEIWRPPAAILHDDAIYPIARWGMERAASRGHLLPFRHLDPEALEQRLRQVAGAAAPPWVVTDGFCAGCGRPAPLDAYAALLRRREGMLIVDDAQGIGVYGEAPSAETPYGRGGGGSARAFGLTNQDNVVLVASLAKAFGAPLAMVAGSRRFIDELTSRSETLVHCSPPPAPTLAAARRALALNAEQGDGLRARLVSAVRLLRQELGARGVDVRGGLHPVQRVPMPDRRVALALRQGLSRRGVEAVVRHARCNDEISLTFIVTARHDERQLRSAAAALSAAASDCRRVITQTSCIEPGGLT